MRAAIILGLLLLLPALAIAADINCTFKTSCTGTEIGVLKAQNDTGGYHNAHAELINESGTYNYTLCCTSDENHPLNATCSNQNTTAILRASSATNAHVQTPSFSNYDHDICLGNPYGTTSCEYVNSTCTGDNKPLISIASSGENNATNAHIGNYSAYKLNVCCTIGKSPPNTPSLIAPTNDNTTVFDRTPTLNWTQAFEPDGDPVTYNLSLNITPGSCAVQAQESGLTNTHYNPSELCTDQAYEWSVQACDVDGCSAWTPVWNFTIPSTLGITFIQNTTSFASLLPGETNDTEAGPGAPMLVENSGNIVSDVTINATGALFQQAGLDTQYFQYKGAENESGAYALAQATYANVSATHTSLFTNLSYIDANDDGLIHYRATVPPDEPVGARSTTIIARVTAS